MEYMLVGVFLYVWSTLMALIEINVEGPVGWALAAPTWRRESRIYSVLMGGKELTGYHLWMFVLPLVLLHAPFVFAPYWRVSLWSMARECELIACYFMLYAHWDFSWFILNPDFKGRFRRGQIWWHQKWVGGVPQDYVAAVVLTALFGSLAHWSSGEALVWLRLGLVVAVLVIGLEFTRTCAPAFHEWHWTAIREYSRALAWEHWLDHAELARLELALGRLHGVRAELAELGRIRAEREQGTGRIKALN